MTIPAYQPVAVTLTADQWDTIRLALLLHSCDRAARPDGEAYAEMIHNCYRALYEAFPPTA